MFTKALHQATIFLQVLFFGWLNGLSAIVALQNAIPATVFSGLPPVATTHWQLLSFASASCRCYPCQMDAFRFVFSKTG